MQSNHSQDYSNHDKEILFFYKENYLSYSNGLSHPDLSCKYFYACALLGIEQQDIADHEKRDSRIKEKVKELKLKFHPDKIKDKNNVELRQCAHELFVLIGIANDVILKIIDTPTFDFSKKIIQPPTIPKHQYELSDSLQDRFSNPFFYLDMARSESLFKLKEYWLEAPAGSQIAIKSEGVAQFNSIEVTMPGYQAFCKLFLSKALPHSFDRSYLCRALRLGTGTVNSYIINDALTDPRFLTQIPSQDIYELAIETKIAKDIPSVFIYYYTHFPNIIFADFISYLTKEAQKDEKRVVINHLIAHPENLTYFYPEALESVLHLAPELLKIILDNRELQGSLSSYFESVHRTVSA